MAEYIYFVASLPYVSFEKDSPITYAEFMEKAKEQLKNKDYLTLSKATFTHESDKENNHIIRDWDKFNYTLSEYITQERAHKLGLVDKKFLSRAEKDERIEAEAREIVAITNPMEAENAILARYFAFLSNHSVESQFSLDALIIYGLLLQIKERASRYSAEDGRKEFDSLYSKIRNDISLRSNL